MAELSAVHKAVILSMAKNDMRLSDVAVELHYHRNTIEYHCEILKRLYGLNPKRFYDLCKLVEMVKEDNHG